MSSDVSSIYSQDNLNSHKANRSPIYEFARFRLDAARRMLYENNQPVALAPKVVETLVVLVESNGEVVSKEELMNRLWADSSVEESNLTQNIYLLRKTLGLATDGKSLIETFRRRGYRFNGQINKSFKNDHALSGETPDLIASNAQDAELKVIGDDDSPLVLNKTSAAREIEVSLETKKHQTVFVETKKKQYFPERKNWYLFAGAAFGLFILAFYGVPLFSIDRQSNNAQTTRIGGVSRISDLKMARLTPDINAENPTISPDGKFFVYAKRENNKRSVWLTDIAANETKQILPPTTGGYDSFQFSPDGGEIYLVVYQPVEPRYVIARIPLTGGALQKIAQNSMSPFTLSPDGRYIAFVRQQTIVIANTNGNGERHLVSRDGETRWFESWGAQPSWSPDGKRIVICGGLIKDGKPVRELIEVLVADGSQKIIPIPLTWDAINDVQWLPDETGMLLTARETSAAPFQIWFIKYPTGEVSRITQDFQNYDWLSLSADGHLLIAEQETVRYNIWTAPLNRPKDAKQLTFGAAASDGFWGLTYTSDGKIVYTSPRDGNLDLWMMDSDGSNQRQLTARAGENSRPQSTPNGRYIVFSSSRTGLERIWRIDADGGNPLQLTNGSGVQTRPVISPDGNWVYYLQAEGNRGDIWKVSIEGSEPIRVSEKEIISRLYSISPDGKLLIFEQYDKNSPVPWQKGLMTADRGEVVRLFETEMGGPIRWTEDSKSLIYLESSSNANFWQQSLNGGSTRRITEFDSQIIRFFDTSSDWQNIVFSRGNTEGEAILITNFLSSVPAVE